MDDKTCYNLAGEAKVANKWEILNETDPESGLRIHLNPGSIKGQNSTVIFELACDINGTLGELTLENEADFDPLSTTNTLRGKSKDSNY